jgi:hypothetical protein
MTEGVSAEAALAGGPPEASKPSGGGGGAVEVNDAPTAANHFGHRETDDIVVDLFWSRSR